MRIIPTRRFADSITERSTNEFLIYHQTGNQTFIRGLTITRYDSRTMGPLICGLVLISSLLVCTRLISLVEALLIR